MFRIIFASLLSVLLPVAVTAAEPTCTEVSPSQLSRNRSAEVPRFQASEPTLAEATRYMIQYFNAWNQAAESSRILNTKGGSDADFTAKFETVMNFYHPGVQVIVGNSSQIEPTPELVLPGEVDFAKNNFFKPFLQKQAGSSHRFNYICLNKNMISVGFQYYAPKKGKRLNSLIYPSGKDVAVDMFVVGNYQLNEQGQIHTMKLTYDFFKFHVDSVRGNISL